MKRNNRLLAVLMALLVLTGLLCGCSGKPDAPADPAPSVSPSADVKLEDVYSRIVDSGVLPKMYILEDAYIQNYYGIAPEVMSDGIFAVADDPMMADTVIVVKVTGQGSTADIEANFTRINQQRLMEMESYNPEQYQRAEDAVIRTDGQYVYYIISDNNDAIITLLEESIG